MSKSKDLMTAWAAHKRAHGHSISSVKDPEPVQDNLEMVEELPLEENLEVPILDEPAPSRSQVIENIIKKLGK